MKRRRARRADARDRAQRHRRTVPEPCDHERAGEPRVRAEEPERSGHVLLAPVEGGDVLIELAENQVVAEGVHAARDGIPGEYEAERRRWVPGAGPVAALFLPIDLVLEKPRLPETIRVAEVVDDLLVGVAPLPAPLDRDDLCEALEALPHARYEPVDPRDVPIAEDDQRVHRSAVRLLPGPRIEILQVGARTLHTGLELQVGGGRRALSRAP
jgi:hypothetical protein